ncbi:MULTISPECIES: sigma-E processing peptidase SpoIIGA [Heyndrickxia]|uniref:sigma-E processing peptidase SpoIIGA n=1 Tax=Heyndrickxia TaxID=2837504 RepID=UPI002DB8C9C9|nr:sigma-E processing peptidase SpoIIGA [Weizmannia sp. CD-2023]MEC2304782.1 sigma-E processing peptidase SpoIIGA [Weizmannia sp. CD-2023]MEC2339965.1 sigma-E processing peptidase SpoIIGA [Weizmannia sp. CD-2023]
MRLVVYMDAIWLLNFLADSLLLWLTSIALKRPARLLRILAGGLIGSAIIIMGFMPQLSYYAGNPVVKLLFSGIMVFAVFGYKRWRYFFSNLLTFYFATFLMGGILMGAHYFLSFHFDMQVKMLKAAAGGFGDPVSWAFVALGLPAAWLFSKNRIQGLEMAKIKYDQLVDVYIRIGESDFIVKGLVDSGNQLYDPLTKLPVMILSILPVREHLPDEIAVLAEDATRLVDGSVALPDEWAGRVRFIPAKTVGKQSLLLAYKPDEVQLTSGNRTWPVKKVLISFSAQRLSGDDAFSCIVHPQMMAEAAQSA